MHLFKTFIVRQLLHEPLRSGGTIVGIALGIAVVIAIQLANASSLRGFETALEAMSGRTSVEIIGPPLGIDENTLADLLWLRQFGEVSPVVEGDALWEGPELIRVLGIDILRDQPFREYSLIEFRRDARRLPTAGEILDLLLDPRSIILTEKFARRHGIEVGSEVSLLIGDRAQRFVVNGLLKDEGPARALDGNFALMDIAAAQLAFDKLGRLDRLDVRLHDPSSIDRSEAEIASRLPEGLTAQRPARRGRQVEQMLAAFHLNLTALSYIALLVGLFLVYNTVSVSVVARREEIGTLRAVGVTRRRVLALFLGEAAALAIVGCAIGIGLGLLLAHGAVGLTETTVSTLYIAAAAAPPALGWGHVGLAFGVGVPLALLAAALPAVEASRVAPMAAIRGADRIETRYRVPRRWLLVSFTLLAAGAWLATREAIGGLPLAGYAAALAFVFGAAFLVPAVLFAAARVGGAVMTRLFGVEGWLANSNLGGAIPRLSVSVAALAVSLSMMVAIAVMIGSFRTTVIYWVGQTLKADLFVSASTRSGGARQSTISSEVDALVSGHPDVATVDRFRNVSIPYGDSQIFLGAGDFEVLLSRGNLVFSEPADGRDAMRQAIGRDAVVVTEAFSRRYGVRVGDEVLLPTPAGQRGFRVAGIYYDYSSDRGGVVMDRRTFARHFGDARPVSLAVYLRGGADAERVRAQLLEAIGGRHRVFIHTNATLRQEVLRIFDATFAITYALEIIAVVVAIMGVAGTLLTLILERRRELAMLRLVGADRRQVRKMVMLEAAMLGGVSQAIGLAVGILLSLVLIYVINVQSFGWTIQFDLPVGFLAQMSVVILVATALAGLYPARLASRIAVSHEVVEE